MAGFAFLAPAIRGYPETHPTRMGDEATDSVSLPYSDFSFTFRSYPTARMPWERRDCCNVS